MGNGDIWGNRKIEKKAIEKNLQTYISLLNFENISELFHKMFWKFKKRFTDLKIFSVIFFFNFDCPRSLKINESTRKVFLGNNFLHSQFSFLFLRQNYSYYIHDDSGVFFSFRIILISFSNLFPPFILFLLQKDFDIFHVLLFKFLNIFLIRIFFVRIFFIGIRGNFNIVNKIFSSLFFFNNIITF